MFDNSQMHLAWPRNPAQESHLPCTTESSKWRVFTAGLVFVFYFENISPPLISLLNLLCQSRCVEMHRSDGRLEYSLFLRMCTAGGAWGRLVRETEGGLVEAGEGEREYIYLLFSGTDHQA